MGQMILWGQGEMHLRVALERLIRKYGAGAATYPRRGPLQGDDPEANTGAWPPQEAVGRPWPVRRCRHRHQAADLGAAAFDFSETITGGVVPKKYIPSVEHGVRDYPSLGSAWAFRW